MQPIEIFKPGKHTAMSGETLNFTEEQLKASAQAYDPAKHEAPIVVGHPRSDAPAYGWVKDLSYSESLVADPEQIEPQFAEMVGAGRFKKVSASFYPPKSPNNPVPGVYYLRHVGFLGAQPPAVKGLKEVEFGEADDVVTVEFGETDVGTLRQILRRLREWIIDRDGRETANEVVPEYALEDIERPDPQSELEGSPMYSENEEGSVPDQNLKQREAEIARRERQLEEREASFAESRKTEQRQALKGRVEKLVTAGQVLPKDKEGLVAFLEHIDPETELSFGEGKEATKEAAGEWLLAFLEQQPAQVDYGERGAPRGDEQKVPRSMNVADGYEVDPEQAALHNRAVEYAEKNQVDIVTAANAVQKQEA